MTSLQPFGTRLQSAAYLPLLNAARFEHAKLNDPFFEKTNYLGAMGQNDWTKGWCNWEPQMMVY